MYRGLHGYQGSGGSRDTHHPCAIAQRMKRSAPRRLVHVPHSAQPRCGASGPRTGSQASTTHTRAMASTRIDASREVQLKSQMHAATPLCCCPLLKRSQTLACKIQQEPPRAKENTGGHAEQQARARRPPPGGPLPNRERTQRNACTGQAPRDTPGAHQENAGGRSETQARGTHRGVPQRLAKNAGATRKRGAPSPRDFPRSPNQKNG